MKLKINNTAVNVVWDEERCLPQTSGKELRDPISYYYYYYSEYLLVGGDTQTAIATNNITS